MTTNPATPLPDGGPEYRQITAPQWPGFVRTYVPILVGALVTWLAGKGITLAPEVEAAVTTLIGAGAAAAYYALVRLLERRWPGFGRLLGAASQPVYLRTTR